MKKPTKSGVWYDLSASPYTTVRGRWVFVFSSKTHKDKFDSNMRIKEEWLTDSLSRRFKVRFNAGELALFQLYQNVETRGFLVHEEFSGGNILTHTSPDTISFHVGRD